MQRVTHKINHCRSQEEIDCADDAFALLTPYTLGFAVEVPVVLDPEAALELSEDDAVALDVEVVLEVGEVCPAVLGSS